MSLEIHRLSKSFGSVVAVDNVSLAINKGEFFSLLGPSGCGKTTLLRTIAGIYTPDSGDLLLGGRDITGLAMSARNIALVFQNYALFPHLTVFDNVAFGLKMRRRRKEEIRKKVSSVLELVHLSGFDSRYPGQLSGGQQQRVALARALVVEPELLLLDEPLSNLDAKLRETMRHEVREIQRKVGITTVLVTHDIHEAFAMSDRIAVMNSGQIEQVGTPVDIYARPSTSFTAQFSGQTNRLEGRVKSRDDESATVETDSGLTLKLPGSHIEGGTEDRITMMLRPERIRLSSQPRGLENRFEGTIESMTYLGSTILYQVRISNTELMVQSPNRGEDGYRPGSQVCVEWNDGDVYVQY